MKTALSFERKKQLLFKRFFLLALTLFVSAQLFAGYTTPAVDHELNISADKALNSSAPAFTRLENILLSEQSANDFAKTCNRTESFILTAPDGWVFKEGAGSVSVKRKTDIRNFSIKVTSTSIIICFQVTATTFVDMLTISGIETAALNGMDILIPAQIYRSSENAGTACIANIISTSQKNGSNGTGFYCLNQMAGAASKLIFSNNPGEETTATPFQQQPAVSTADQFGNFTTAALPAMLNVEIRLSSGDGILAGTTLMNIGTAGGNGKISFSDLQVDKSGRKKLLAKAGSLSFAISHAFTVEEQKKIISDSESMCVNGQVPESAKNIILKI